jgi:hypothetical protein
MFLQALVLYVDGIVISFSRGNAGGSPRAVNQIVDASSRPREALHHNINQSSDHSEWRNLCLLHKKFLLAHTLTRLDLHGLFVLV